MPILAAFGPGRDESLPATGGSAARRFPTVAMPPLDYTDAVARSTSPVHCSGGIGSARPRSTELARLRDVGAGWWRFWVKSSGP